MEGVKEQLQGIRKRVPCFIGRQRWRYRERLSPWEVCVKPTVLGLNENSCENDACGQWLQF